MECEATRGMWRQQVESAQSLCFLHSYLLFPKAVTSLCRQAEAYTGWVSEPWACTILARPLCSDPAVHMQVQCPPSHRWIGTPSVHLQEHRWWLY